MPEEKIVLTVDGNTAGAEQALTRIRAALDRFDKQAQATQTTTQQSGNVVQRFFSLFKQSASSTSGATSGLGGFLGTLRQFYQNASQGQQGLAGLANVIGSLNPVVGTVLNGVLGLVSGLRQLSGEAVQVVSNAQGLEISLQSLAARELVKSGQFSNATEAMDTAKVAANGLLTQIQELSIQSPFQGSQVVETFRLGMGYGFSADQAMRLTEATLNVAAGMNLTGADMAEVNRVFGQMRSTGKLLTQDLNQLRSRGIDVAGMLQDNLGVSVEQFNAGLQSGTYSMNDLLDTFTQFSATNFGGAAERMSKTITGLKSSLADLKEVAYVKLLKPALDQLTAAAAEGFGWLSDLVMQSGMLEKAGAALSTLVGKAIEAGKAFIGWLKPGLDVVTKIEIRKTLSDISMWFGLIAADVREVGSAIYAYIRPALQWLSAAWQGLNWAGGLAQLRDAVNVAGQLIYGFVEMLRRLLTGQSATAFDPLRSAFVNVLTLIATAWDRMIAGAVTWGWNLVVQIANGIMNAARTVLTSALTAIGNFIGQFLKPGSPPKKGPLSQIAEWGRGVMAVFVGGFKLADFNVFRDALAPIRAALQGAVQAGTLDEAGFASTFAAVRQDVSQLINVFRQTGQISDEVLGGIAAKLGEGGEELTKFLRLQLNYQKAQEALAGVEAEVAAAEKKGFVPAALRAKQKAAQAAANAAKDELDWQKEFLSVQQDSVDLQVQLVKALSKLADALDKVTGGGLGKESTGGAGELAAPEIPFTSTLGGLGGAPITLDIEGEQELQNALGGISQEFQAMREKVAAWLKLPIEDKIRTVLDELGQALGIDLSGTFEDLVGWLDTLAESDLGQALQDLFTNGLSALTTNGPAWAQKLSTGLLDLFLTAIANLSLGYGKLSLQAYNWLFGLIRTFLNSLSLNAEPWGRSLGSGFGAVVGKIFTFLTETLPEWQAKMRDLPLQLFNSVVEWLKTNGPTYASAWAASVKGFVGNWMDLIRAEGPNWLTGLTEFARAFVVTFVTAFVENAPEDMQDTLKAGIEFVDKLKTGIVNAWDMLTFTRDKVTNWVKLVIFNFATWIINLAQTGKTIVDTLKAGVTAAWDFLEFIKSKFAEFVQTLTTNPGDIFEGLLGLGGLIVGKIKTGVETAWDLLAWVGGKLKTLWDGLLTDTGWQTAVQSAGAAFVTNLRTGIANAWDNFIAWLKGKLGILADYLPGSEPKRADSPLRGLGQRGAALVNNFAAGIDFSSVQRKLRAELATVQGALSGTAAGLNGGVNVYLNGGMEFPNVRSGRDASGFKDALRRQTLEAAMRGKV